MDALILVLFLLLRLGCASSFLVVLNPKKLCLLTYKQMVILGQCDITNPAQQWTWLDGARLINTKSSLCLWADPSPRLPVHARLVNLRPCSVAPAWKCNSTTRTFGLAETQMYLKKQGARVAMREKPNSSDWSRYEVDSGGNKLISSLCPETETTLASDSFHVSTHKPLGVTSTVYAIRSPTITVINEHLSNTVKTHRTTRQVTTSKVHSSITNGTSSYINDINKPRTRRSVTADFNPDGSSSVTEHSGLNSSHIVSSSTTEFTTDPGSTDVLENSSHMNTSSNTDVLSISEVSSTSSDATVGVSAVSDQTSTSTTRSTTDEKVKHIMTDFPPASTTVAPPTTAPGPSTVESTSSMETSQPSTPRPLTTTSQTSPAEDHHLNAKSPQHNSNRPNHDANRRTDNQTCNHICNHHHNCTNYH
ncbi:mucin-2-like [Scomber scombrus]|uniref:mucin-2-like n=1 Tax=Scomber scombrus TaxID=13677 RepID=UPI002DDBDC41|nr:mucin-2-like [Scomber scombrus]